MLHDEKLVENSRVMGEALREGLRKMKSPLITDVRGKGLLIGVEIDVTKTDARTVCERLMDNGILTKETHETVVRLAPPLIIDRPILDWALGRIEEALKTIL